MVYESSCRKDQSIKCISARFVRDMDAVESSRIVCELGIVMDKYERAVSAEMVPILSSLVSSNVKRISFLRQIKEEIEERFNGPLST